MIGGSFSSTYSMTFSSGSKGASSSSPIDFTASDGDGPMPLQLRIVYQPQHGTVGLAGNSARINGYLVFPVLETFSDRFHFKFTLVDVSGNSNRRRSQRMGTTRRLDYIASWSAGSAAQAELLDELAVPVLILSAKRTVDDRVLGLQQGGDDYLTKPFAFSQLLARVQALIRRASGATEPTRLTTGPPEMDLIGRKVMRDGEQIELQPLEFSLLEYLMRNADRVVSKTMIMEHVWDYNFDPQTNVIDVHMSRLHSKIDKGFDTPMLKTAT